MKFRFGRKFWIIVTTIIVVFTVFVIGRHVVHAVKIKRQINALNREKERHQQKIARDSALLEQLRYDDYLEEYAREHYHMQRRDEHVYIIEE
ncbi:septum formation initiator family protein [uncultured Alistipes sp.]|uniref:FtsB family cell division protein n=1 Tax=uncultured Alistipes sp. TaxID=538949 RepID=UPI0026110FB0|nr:septum formation initiator family protein [uncultured Alistipes sp.]